MKEHDQLLREYHSYTCKMNIIREETGERIRPLGFAEWLELREEPKRPDHAEGK